jgi:hypothetical protein
MSIATYSELVTAITRWTKRSDISTYVADYIMLAESRLYNGDDGQLPSKALRLRLMQSQESGTITGATIAFPTRYLETISLRAVSSGSSYPLRYLAPANFSERVNNTTDAGFYSILNNTIVTAGSGAGAYQHDYYAKLLPLNSTNTTNALLTEAPNVYLFAACLEAALDLRDEQLEAQMYRRMVGAINALQNQNNNVYAGGSLAVMVGR